MAEIYHIRPFFPAFSAWRFVGVNLFSLANTVLFYVFMELDSFFLDDIRVDIA